MTREEAEQLFNRHDDLSTPDKAYLLGYARPDTNARAVCQGMDNEREVLRSFMMGQADSLADNPGTVNP